MSLLLDHLLVGNVRFYYFSLFDIHSMNTTWTPRVCEAELIDLPRHKISQLRWLFEPMPFLNMYVQVLGMEPMTLWWYSKLLSHTSFCYCGFMNTRRHYWCGPNYALISVDFCRCDTSSCTKMTKSRSTEVSAAWQPRKLNIFVFWHDTCPHLRENKWVIDKAS